ncbi:MAG: hypothetical protein L3J93_04955, partial [Thermoplasmata archaeon]|nr:hypothetical protein [Thermoplasmata archaeon]
MERGEPAAEEESVRKAGEPGPRRVLVLGEDPDHEDAEDAAGEMPGEEPHRVREPPDPGDDLLTREEDRPAEEAEDDRAPRAHEAGERRDHDETHEDPVSGPERVRARAVDEPRRREEREEPGRSGEERCDDDDDSLVVELQDAAGIEPEPTDPEEQNGEGEPGWLNADRDLGARGVAAAPLLPPDLHHDAETSGAGRP